MSLIPDEIISQIKQQIDIEEVIGGFVSLKRKGNTLWACCPFHYEKSPSFAVNPSKNIFKCFGCGKSGDAITFVQELEGLSYAESMKYFAQKYGIEIKEDLTEEEIVSRNLSDSLHIILNYAKNVFVENINSTEEGINTGLKYFYDRGFTDETIKKFELGYSLNQWDSLLTNATSKGYKKEFLEKTGLIVSQNNKHYDRFRGRAIFPIHNQIGKTIAFGARILQSDKNQPKYINSPETEVYHKSNVLYGLFQSKQKIRQENNCFLVEGYTDVISLHQGGIENVVASSGTSLTEEQIRLIKRYSDNITILYDGDPAGIKASLRGIDMILEEGLDVSIVLFPDNNDPDSFIRKEGKEKFEEFILKNKKDFIQFKHELFLKDSNSSTLQKADAVKDIILSITKIPDEIKRNLFLQQCSKITSINESVLISELNNILKANKSKQATTQEAVKSKQVTVYDQLEMAEFNIIKTILLYGDQKIDDKTAIQYILDETADIESRNAIYNKIISIIRDQYAINHEINKDILINHSDEEIRKISIDFLIDKYEISNRWKDYNDVVSRQANTKNQVINSILKYKQLYVKKILNEKSARLSVINNKEEEISIMNDILELQKFNAKIQTMLVG